MYPIISLSQSLNNNNYKEINVGLYVIPVYFVFPGASFLCGKTKYYSNNTLLDYQIGIAFPTIITGKVGYGIGNRDCSTIFGIRPFPISAYVKFSFNKKIT